MVKKIHLTFDIEYPSKESTSTCNFSEIVDLLAKHSVKGTFFFEGRWLHANSKKLLEFRKSGHKIGNHTYHHSPSSRLNLFGLRREILDTDALLRKYTVQDRISLLRLPYGDGRNLFRVRFVLKIMRRRHFHWNVNSFDYKLDSTKIINHIEDEIRKIGSESIATVLFHSWPDSTLTGLKYLLEKYPSDSFVTKITL